MTLTTFGQILVNGIVVSSVYVLLAVGFNLVWGILGIFNFAHGHFYMLGAFLAWFMISSLGFSFYPAFILAGLAIFLVAALSLKFVLGPVRNNEFVCVIISLGLVNLIEGVVTAIFGGEARMVRLPLSGIINMGGIILSYARFTTVVISFIVLGIFLYIVYYTKFGRALRAIGSDPEIAQVQGINVSRILFFTFCIGTTLAGIGGIVACHMTPLEPHMGFDFSVKAFIIVVIGGLGSIPGAILGAFVIGLIESFVGTIINPTIATIVSFIVILGIILVKPSGLMGVASRE
jgi:branched-chain amino acid transport system permease protein